MIKIIARARVRLRIWVMLRLGLRLIRVKKRNINVELIQCVLKIFTSIVTEERCKFATVCIMTHAGHRRSLYKSIVVSNT